MCKRPGTAASYLCIIGLLTAAGCAPVLPTDSTDTLNPERELIETQTGSALYSEAGVDDAQWLEMDRPADAGGPIGGYFTAPASARNAFVLVLQGANPAGADNRLAHTLTTHRTLSASFANAGFIVWTPIIRECGTAYGQDDLVDVLDIIDWLLDGGAAELAADRIYVVGYSKGATLATLANLQRTLTAYVSLNGLPQPDQLERDWLFYQILTSVWTANEGFCQLKSTLDTYGSPGAPGWDTLDAVSRVTQLTTPELFVHTTADPVYEVENTKTMNAHYQAALDAGETVVPLDFLYIPGGDHFVVRTDPAIHQQVIDYLNRFEPAD